MSTRRDVLKQLAALSAAGALPRAVRALPWSAASIERVGMQLYTVRAAMNTNVPATLQAVAKIGYREVEFAGYFKHSPADIRRMLDDNGLRSPSTHLGLEEVRQRFDIVADAAHVMGHRYLTVPSLDMRSLKTPDDWKRVADIFNDVGRKAQSDGLRFAFHNHATEFALVQGRVPMDILLDGTDASLVAFEMDLYWLTQAGAEARAYFARFPGRFELVHAKDSRGAPEHVMTEVGAGTMDWKGIFAQHKKAGIRHYFVEHDHPADPMGSIRTSYDYLKALKF
jgi:sugar phosphate isomerase/epimerase